MLQTYQGWSALATLSLCFPHTTFACPAANIPILQKDPKPVEIGRSKAYTIGDTQVIEVDYNDQELFNTPAPPWGPWMAPNLV